MAIWKLHSYRDGGDHEISVDESGVARWTSNGNVPPSEWVYRFFAETKAPINIAACDKARDKEIEDSITQYRQQREKHGYSDEELFEMEAAFGKGATVVDIFTGKRIKV